MGYYVKMKEATLKATTNWTGAEQYLCPTSKCLVNHGMELVNFLACAINLILTFDKRGEKAFLSCGLVHKLKNMMDCHMYLPHVSDTSKIVITGYYSLKVLIFPLDWSFTSQLKLPSQNTYYLYTHSGHFYQQWDQ